MIFKVVIFALVAYALYRMFMNDRKKKEEKSTKAQESRVASGEMVKDPVCVHMWKKTAASLCVMVKLFIISAAMNAEKNI